MNVVSAFLRVSAPALALALLPTTAPAQLADWKRGFENPGVDGTVLSMLDFDDGHGMALYVGGYFTFAGTISTNGIARWDGLVWSAVGKGFLSGVTAMAVFDDGTGPELYAAGSFLAAPPNTYTNLARWNGTTWTPLPDTTGPIDALAVFDDGTGPALYAGGHFLAPGGARNVARLTASGWAPLGPGLGSNNDSVYALAVHDDGMGGGPALYAGGSFTVSGSASIIDLARWNGSSWSAVGAPLEPASRVYALTEFTDNQGGGTRLYAGGSLLDANGNPLGPVLRWDGAAWSPLAGGVLGASQALKVFDDGSGPALYVGGSIAPPGGGPFSRVARWDGSSWSLSNWNPSHQDQLNALGSLQRGGTPTLYAGGNFVTGNGVDAENIARLVNGRWIGLGRGQGLDNAVWAILPDSHLNGQNHQLFAAGWFHTAGTIPAEGIARWDGVNWHPLGSGIVTNPNLTFPMALAEYDDGNGMKLYATGVFNSAGGVPVSNIAAWDGANWSALGRGLNGYGGRAVAAWANGGAPGLYVGGSFTVAGSTSANNIARWDGSGWSALGNGVNGNVGALLVHDFGAGPSLYVAGQFTMAGTTPVLNAAWWDGSNWHALGNLSMTYANCLAAYDDGSGAGDALYAGGTSFNVGGSNVMRWDGTSWSPVGGSGVGSITQSVNVLAAHDDGTGGGTALYAAGLFDGAGTTCAHNLARWNGQWWEEVAGNVDGNVHAMGEAANASGGPGSLFVGGYVRYAGGRPSRYIAELSSQVVVGTGFCYGDGADPLVTVHCPCSNVGLRNHGCANFMFQGCRFGASGSVPDDVTLTASNLPPAYLTLLLSGSTVVNGGVVYGDGIRCISGLTRRLGFQLAMLNTVSFRVVPQLPGSVVRYEVVYRDPYGSFCPPATFNVTNAVEIDW